MNPIQNNLKFFYEKTGEYSDEIPLIIMNNFVSYNNPLIASDVDKHFFKTNQEMNKMRLFLAVQKQRTPYISYFKILESEDDLEFLFKKIRKYYDISKREFNIIKQYYKEKFNDKEVLREYFKFFGIEEKYYKKYGLDFEKKKRGLGDFI